jgi:hypothetical protein
MKSGRGRVFRYSSRYEKALPNGPFRCRVVLHTFAQRLETLERENAELRSKVASLESSGTRRHAGAERASESSEADPEGRMSRRRMLGRAGAAAAGLVVDGAFTQRDIREAKAAIAESSNDASIPAVKGTNTFGGVGVSGKGLYGVEGDSDGATGQGVHGMNSSAGDGVLGDSDGGAGIRGRSFGGATGAVAGKHFGNGYGGLFEGGKAQLRLILGSAPGRPKDGLGHQKGEIYLDSAGHCLCASSAESLARGGRSPLPPSENSLCGARVRRVHGAEDREPQRQPTNRSCE